MPYIEWTQEFSVGVEDMDSEHKQWISILNTLFDAINRGIDNHIIGDIIDRMITYSKYHLTHEEMFLEDIRYPHLEMHKMKHDELLRKLNRIKEQFESGASFKLTIDAIKLLKEWLSNHIQITDKKYAHYMKAAAAE
jgi:hemerythrin